MPKDKQKKKKGAHFGLPLDRKRDFPSDECRNFVIRVMVMFYETNSTMALQSKYVRYREEGVEKFKSEMSQTMRAALSAPEWTAEVQKRGFDMFLKERVHDSLYNAKNILIKFGKENRPGDATFTDVVQKAHLFSTQLSAYSKSRNRRGSIGWWGSQEGQAERRIQMSHLIALSDVAKVIAIDGIVKRGGYATIRRVRISGAPGILEHWEFAAKLSVHYSTKPELAKLEHQNETMAVRIGHAGVIRFAAIHSHKPEGYSYWWNGRTIREMLNMDKQYSEHVYEHLLHSNLSVDEAIQANQLVRFRKKRTELAWALLHIMNEVHKSGHLHNDISPDNVLLHFPEFPDDETKVYIGICDWGLTSSTRDRIKTKYTFTDATKRDETLARRWWVDPEIAFLHKHDVQFETIPELTRASEEYAIAKIAQQINGECMSQVYHKLQHQSESSVKYSLQDLGKVFHLYMNRCCDNNRHQNGGLSHIITRFTTTHSWPVPYEHFRTLY